MYDIPFKFNLFICKQNIWKSKYIGTNIVLNRYNKHVTCTYIGYMLCTLSRLRCSCTGVCVLFYRKNVI